MLDPKQLRDDFAAIKTALSTRNAPPELDKIPALDERRRELIGKVEVIRAQKNKLGPEIANAKKEGRDVSALLASLKESGDQEKELSQELSSIETEIENIALVLPNLPHATVPAGKNEHDNRTEKVWGTKPTFSFQPKPHWDIAENLGIVDFETAAKLSGARFSLYKGDGARLERALINFMLEHHAARGYVEIIPPLLVKSETMMGSGQLPKFEVDLFKTAEFDPKLYLIPTSEVPLCNLHVDEIIEHSRLPFYYTAYTPCFRAEAGSYGRDVRGLIRLHQFNKVELVKITDDETSWDEHEKLTADAESILEALGLCYRRVTLCTGDMGLAASKTYDLEVWLPGLDAFREISSCSNTADFQARRTKTRFKKGNDKPRFVHMLNGSGLAVGRTFIAVLENYQQADGSVVIPEVLRPYMRGQEVITLTK